MSKKILMLVDGTDYMIDVASIIQAFLTIGSDTLLNVTIGDISGLIQFQHEADPNQLVYKSFKEAIESALSPKSNSETLIRVNLPEGFTLTTDF